MSEFRYSMTSDEWTLISPRRGNKKKADDFKKKGGVLIKRSVSSKKSCPFEDPQKHTGELRFFYPENLPLSRWRLQVVKNKFPALEEKSSIRVGKEKFFQTHGSHGYHDLLITRDHERNFGDLSDEESFWVLRAFAQRIRQVSLDKRVSYVSVTQNFGPTGGATIFHPHYQIFSLPMVPERVRTALNFAEKYFKKAKRCVYCDIICAEAKEKKRIIFSDKDFVSFVPFASKEPFQTVVFPRSHGASFEKEGEKTLRAAALFLKKNLNGIKKNLNDPDYNFYLHTAPVSLKKRYSHYHWHIEVIPVSNIQGGFELATGIQVNPILPEKAAGILRRAGK